MSIFFTIMFCFGIKLFLFTDNRVEDSSFVWGVVLTFIGIMGLIASVVYDL